MERWDLRPGRVVTLPVEADPAEHQLERIEQDTGVRLSECPWRALRDPFVSAVVKAHRSFTKGAGTRLGPWSPAALVLGVECFDAAINAIEVADMKADRAEAERKRDKPGPRTRKR